MPTIRPACDFRDRYRPARLDQVFGQAEAVRRLRGFLRQPYPVCFLFSGPTGTGKTSAGIALANELGVDPAADFFHVKSGGADLNAFEEIARGLRFPPWRPGGWRLILVDEADQATARARQVMLSLLEGLPSRTVVVLTTNLPERFDERTIDRTTHVRFRDDAVRGAQRLVDAIWHAETGSTESPRLAGLPGAQSDPRRVSFRRVATAVQEALCSRAG